MLHICPREELNLNLGFLARLNLLLPAGIEPAPRPSEGHILSIELRKQIWAGERAASYPLNDKGVNLFQSPGRIVQPIPKRIYYHIKTSAKVNCLAAKTLFESCNTRQISVVYSAKTVPFATALFGALYRFPMHSVRRHQISIFT